MEAEISCRNFVGMKPHILAKGGDPFRANYCGKMSFIYIFGSVSHRAMKP
jgi:hypothetical protein